MGAIDSMRFKKETVHYSIIFLAFALCYYYWFNELFRFTWEYSNLDVRTNNCFAQLFYSYLRNGIFMLWNPYVGLGTAAVTWAHIPIDQYTIFNLLFNNNIQLDFVFRIIDFALLHFAMWVFLRYFKLNYLYAFMAVVFFFILSYIKYFFFFGFKNNIFISLPLLIVLTFMFMEKQRYKHLLYLIITLNFCFLGTKLEYWFITCTWFTFFFWLTYLYFLPRKPPGFFSTKKVIIAFVAIVLSTLLTNLWQFRILLNYLGMTSRGKASIIDNILNFEYIRPLLQTFFYSEILTVGAFLFFGYLLILLARKTNKEIDIFPFVSAIFLVAVVIKTICSIQPSIIAHLLDLIKGYSIYFEDLKNLFQSLAFQLFLLLLFIYTVVRKFILCHPIKLTFEKLLLIIFLFQIVPYCYLSKNWFDHRYFSYVGSHVKIIFLLAFMVGVIHCHKEKIILLSLINILFIYFMRTHVQILLMKILNIVWHVQRDNQIIDIFAILVALFGVKYFLDGFVGMFRMRILERCNFKLIVLIILCLILLVENKDQILHMKEPIIIKGQNITQTIEAAEQKIHSFENINYFSDRNKLQLDDLFRVNLHIHNDAGMYTFYNNFKCSFFDFSHYDSVISDDYKTLLRKSRKKE